MKEQEQKLNASGADPEYSPPILLKDGCNPTVPLLEHHATREQWQMGLIPLLGPGVHRSKKESICFQLFCFPLLLLLIVVIVELVLFAESQNINN